MNRIYLALLGICLLLAAQPALAQNDKLQHTIDSLNLVIHKEPSNPFPVYHKAMLFLTTGSKDEAFRFFKQVGLMYFQNPHEAYNDIAADSYYRMAEMAYGRSKKEAYNYALSALKVKPKEKAYRLMSARTLARVPETQADGESQFEELIKDYPTDTEVLLEYAQYLETASPDRAAAMYQKVLRNNPTDAQSLYALGNFEVNKGLKQTNPDLAVQHYQAAEGYLFAAYQQAPANNIYKKKLADLYSNMIWYYKRQKNKEATAKHKEYQGKLDGLAMPK